MALSARASITSAAKPVAYPIIFTSGLRVALPATEAQATDTLLTADGRPFTTSPCS